MPFDPTLPQAGTENHEVQLRSQLSGLMALIGDVPAAIAAVVDGVQTLLPNEAAYVMLTVSAETLHFLFGIPRGDEGVQGEPGIQGEPGVQGPPFANAVVDAVTTLTPSDPATVSVSFDGTNVHFNFGIPRGYTGADGTPGPPGEVSLAQLTSAINTTSSNSNAVTTLGLVVSDPPTQGEMQSLADKMDELILALRR